MVIYMYQEERLYQILNLLRERKSLSKQEIMENFQISRDTARRDIICLVNEGLALRTHGGITLPTIQITPGYKERAGLQLDKKNQIGKMAAAYIKRGSVCYLDSSTTVQYICNYIKEKTTIYSNSIDIIEQMQDNKNAELHILGGKWNTEDRYIYGSEALAMLDNIHFDIAFLGTTSVTEDGFYTCGNEDAAIKRLVAKKSSFVCVLADSGKFLFQPSFKFAKLNDVDIVLTTKMPPKSIITALAKANCSLIWNFNEARGDKD